MSSKCKHGVANFMWCEQCIEESMGIYLPLDDGIGVRAVCSNTLNVVPTLDSIKEDPTLDKRNVQDKYKSWETDLIKRDLAESRSGFVPVFLNVEGDFNLSSGVRNSNWFNTKPPWVVGKKKWDRRGAVGTQLYTDIEYVPMTDIALETRLMRGQGYRIVAAEIADTAVPLHNYAWHERSFVMFGEESAGIPDWILELVDDIVMIPGRGSVRSLNVATTCGIFEYDYSVKRGYLNEASME